MENKLISITHQQEVYKVRENAEALLAELYTDVVVYALDFQFAFQGMGRSVVLQFTSSVDGPRRDEVIMLKFNDFDGVHKISASVDHIHHQFFPQGTIQGVNHDGYLMTIFLTGVTEQNI